MPNFLKRIIFIWHRKLFREISFSLLQKIRDDDIIHREEENKKKKRKTKEKKMLATNSKNVTNNLDKIFTAMRNGKYNSVIDTRGRVHMGIINAIMREDGSGKNWIVTVTGAVSEKVFIHAS